MTWIKTIADDDAEGTLARVYNASRDMYGFVPNIRRALSLAPDTLRAYMQLSGTAYRGGVLSDRERELVATVVALANDCHY